MSNFFNSQEYLDAEVAAEAAYKAFLGLSIKAKEENLEFPITLNVSLKSFSEEAFYLAAEHFGYKIVDVFGSDEYLSNVIVDRVSKDV